MIVAFCISGCAFHIVEYRVSNFSLTSSTVLKHLYHIGSLTYRFLPIRPHRQTTLRFRDRASLHMFGYAVVGYLSFLRLPETHQIRVCRQLLYSAYLRLGASFD